MEEVAVVVATVATASTLSVCVRGLCTRAQESYSKNARVYACVTPGLWFLMQGAGQY